MSSTDSMGLVDTARNVLTFPTKSENNKLMFALVVLLILVLIGVVAFGMGGHLVANRGVRAGAWTALSLGPRNREGLMKIGKGQEGYDIDRYQKNSTTGAMWDTPATMKVRGQTIMGWHENKTYGLPQGGKLANL